MSLELDSSTVPSRKVQPIVVSSSSSSCESISGYRIIDLEILSIVFTTFLCPSCDKQKLKLSENGSKKKGLASLLYVQCKACNFIHEFYTSSASAHQSYDVNKRVVYVMGACGQGHAGLETFTSLMNLPKPMTINNYDKIVSIIATKVKEVAEETMQEACEEIHKNLSADLNTVADTSVSCDGSWQRRGFSSLNGVVTAILMKTGKVVDIEAMTRACKACSMKENLKKDDP